jgi:hypothetical protein
MNHFIGKAWPTDTLHHIAECFVMLSILAVVVVEVLRMLGVVY